MPFVHCDGTRIYWRLFGVNPVLIAAVERGETSKAIAEVVMQSEEWARRFGE